MEAFFYMLMSLSREEVLRIAKLARLKLSEEEIATFSPQLSSILEYVNILSEVDTENVKETSQVTGLAHVFREDEVERFSGVDKLLGASSYEIQDDQIKVKKVI